MYPGHMKNLEPGTLISYHVEPTHMGVFLRYDGWRTLIVRESYPVSRLRRLIGRIFPPLALPTSYERPVPLDMVDDVWTGDPHSRYLDNLAASKDLDEEFGHLLTEYHFTHTVELGSRQLLDLMRAARDGA